MLGGVHGQLIFEPKFGLFFCPPSATLQGFPQTIHFWTFCVLLENQTPQGFPQAESKKQKT